MTVFHDILEVLKFIHEAIDKYGPCMMAPLEGFESCSTADKQAEINNNKSDLLDDKKIINDDVEDLGQKLVHREIKADDIVEREAERRVKQGRQLVWFNVFLIPTVHLVAMYALLTHIHLAKWQTWVWGILLGGLGGFGVTAGAHRLWSHRAYKARMPLRIILALCYSIAGQNSLYDWVRDHRVHHKFTETDADPHNVKRGFFFAHVGWLMQKKHPDVLRQGRKVDLSDIMADPVVRMHQKFFFPLKLLLCFYLPTVIPYYSWNETFMISFLSTCFVRYIGQLNFTWLVNSAAHMFGTKPYDKRINPTENIAVSILAMGEGWHNYHHIFPWDYKASEYSYYFNITTFWIDQFAKIGWAYDLKTASGDMVRRVVSRHGDGSHPSSHIEESSHAHPSEITYDEYLEVLKEDDELTGVKNLHNEFDVTRKRQTKFSA